MKDDHPDNEINTIYHQSEYKNVLHPSNLRKYLMDIFQHKTIIIISGIVISLCTFLYNSVVDYVRHSITEISRSYLSHIIITDLDDENSLLNQTIDRKIEDKIDRTTAYVIAGMIQLSTTLPRQVLAFYLPEGHKVDLELDISGLEEGEVLKISTNRPTLLNNKIDRDGSYSIKDIRQSFTDILEEEVNFSPHPERMEGQTKNYFPVVVSLSKSENSLNRDVQMHDDKVITSLVTVKYVGMMSPPVRLKK
ncbi:hypothetical protein P7L79_03600 (plasmid) [Tistrella mobilis]|uniref:hypothetical protein n=1 Tax=Tistrella mobilis TaxID=171437 RepID=UPI003557B8F8